MKPRLPLHSFTRNLTSLALSLSLLALTGCQIPPHEDSPAQLVPAADLGLTGSEASAAPENWWQAYHDPQLDALVERMLQGNPQLNEALSRVRSAQAQAMAVHAGTMPHAELDGEATREHFAEESIYPPPLAGGEYWFGALNLGLSWDLDLFGQQAARLSQAKNSVQASQLDTASAKLVLSGALSQAYVNLYQNYAQADLATQSNALRQKILALTRQRLAQGLDTQAELRQAEQALPQTESTRLQALAAIDSAVHKLALLSNQGAEAYAGIQRPQLDLETALPVPEQLPANLLARRPDIIAAKLRIDAALAGRHAAHQAYYPDINLSAFAGLQAIGLSNLFEDSAKTYGVGPALYLPVFDAGALQAGYHKASAELDAAVASYNQTVLVAIQQVADELSQHRTYALQLIQARKAETAARQRLEVLQQRYRAGLINQLPVLAAQAEVINAQRNVVDALAGQSIARVGLLLALGGSFELPNTSTSTTHAAAANVTSIAGR